MDKDALTGLLFRAGIRPQQSHDALDRERAFSDNSPMTDATDVFISYKREDRSLAEQVAAALRANRYSVYYDIALEHGQEFADALDERIRAAKIVIVLWTDKSVQSKWVRREARFAAKHGKYHPVHVGDIDLPMDLHGYHAVALSERFELEPIVASVLGRLTPSAANPSRTSEQLTSWQPQTGKGRWKIR